MPAWEATQLVLGLTIPLLLTAHFVGNRLAHELYGVADTYARLLTAYWVVAPWRGARAHREGADRFHGARGEPLRRDPARLGLRWARPLLDVPHPCVARPRRAAAAQLSGAAPAPGRRSRARRPAGVPAQPARDLDVTPILATQGGGVPTDAHERQGVEREIVVLFADLRGFTRMAERRLPYDVVFFLNRYFEAVGAGIGRAGGIANQFTGDGVMALFGSDSGPEAGCRQALAAARAMVHGVEALSQELAGELAQPLRLGIGIHVGQAVVGRMGFRDNTYSTAVGDTVHVAARFEQATKDFDCEIVISEDVVRRARVDASAFPRHEITLRNRAKPVVVRVIERVDALSDVSDSPR
ncbi:MAG: adenylate/guanylate cyclase domain-containing protein [Candidatus Rokuibacteriota bacterium]